MVPCKKKKHEKTKAMYRAKRSVGLLSSSSVKVSHVRRGKIMQRELLRVTSPMRLTTARNGSATGDEATTQKSPRHE